MSVEPREILDAVYAGMYIDDEWAVRDGTSFTWWPHRIRQTVRAYEPALHSGEMITRVVAEIPLVRGATAPNAHVMALLPNFTSVLSGLVFDPRDGSLRSRLAVSLWDGNRSWLEKLLLQAVALQVSMVADKGLEPLAEAFGGEVDLQPHPTSGPRRVPDDMVHVSDLHVRGGATTVVAASDFSRLSKEDGQMASLRASGPSAGMRIDGPLPATWSITSSRHPALGWGLLCLLSLHTDVDDGRRGELASALNLADIEQDRSAHSLGGWVPDPDHGVTHHTFVPELVYAREGRPSRIARMANLAIDGMIRTRWAAAWAADLLARRPD